MSADVCFAACTFAEAMETQGAGIAQRHPDWAPDKGVCVGEKCQASGDRARQQTLSFPCKKARAVFQPSGQSGASAATTCSGPWSAPARIICDHRHAGGRFACLGPARAAKGGSWWSDGGPQQNYQTNRASSQPHSLSLSSSSTSASCFPAEQIHYQPPTLPATTKSRPPPLKLSIADWNLPLAVIQV